MKAIVSVINDLVTDQRVKRTCNTLVSSGFSVILVGRKLKKSPPITQSDYHTVRFRMLINKGPLFYAFFNIRLFFFLLFKKSNLLYANDLDTLLANFLVSKIKKIPLIYDSHEYFTEVPELIHRPFVQKIWKYIEKKIFPHLTDIITVNQSIAQLYEKEYGKKIHVVRNISEKKHIERIKSRAELNLPDNKSIIIMQGSGINIQRGAEEALEAMQYIDNAILLFVGGGDVLPVLKKIALQNNLLEKVLFVDKQTPENLYHYTANADIGLSLDKDTNINYKFSLPNKIFDYINAQIPILASPLVEVKKIIEEYDIGCLIESHDPQHIAQKILYMLDDKKARELWKKNLKLASEKLNWEAEQQILRSIIKKYV